MRELAVVMMQKDEGELLASWLRFHESLVGPENVYVIDNVSSDFGTIFQLLEAQKRGVNIRFGEKDFEAKGRIISSLIAELTATYTFAIPLDCDEFVGLLGQEGQYVSDAAALLAELDRASDGSACYLRVPHSIWNIPFTTKGYYLPLKKTVVSRMREPRLDLGYHLYDWYQAQSTVADEMIRESCLCYLHFHNGPFERVLASARRKLLKRVDGFTAQDFDGYRGAGKHLLRYFSMSDRQYMESFPEPTHELKQFFDEKNCLLPFGPG